MTGAVGVSAAAAAAAYLPAWQSLNLAGNACGVEGRAGASNPRRWGIGQHMLATLGVSRATVYRVLAE